MPIRTLKNNGFSLPELLIAALIFTFTFAGIILVFFRCMELSEMARNSSAAVNASKSLLASIENTAFDQISGTYNNTPFTAAGLNGMGVTYVNTISADLLQVTAVFSWREKNGRAIGEDTNINGVLNAGEDTNGNGLLDSPVKLTTSVYNAP